MQEIRLYGELGKRFGRVHRLAVGSVAEAIRALCVNFPEFEKSVLEISKHYRVWSGNHRVGQPERLHEPVSTKGVIRIAPVVHGAKDGFFQVILGAALIAVSFIPGLNVAVWSGLSTTWASIAFSVGASMVLGGISQMLSPTPKNSSSDGERPENKPSYIFNGAVNTTAQGHPVPIGYGRMIVGSAVISAGMTTANI